MPLKRLDDPRDLYRKPCRSLSHDPPSMIYLESGTYEWTCPACGTSVTFTVSHPALGIVPYPRRRGYCRPGRRIRADDPWPPYRTVTP